MGALIFVHPDPIWREQIKKNSSELNGDRVFLFSELSAAYEMIGNSALPIAGIYLSVKERKTSVFSGLEFCLVHRPATPLFLIDQENHPFLRDLGVMFGFSGSADFKELTSPLRLDPRRSSSPEVRQMGMRLHPEYVAVPTVDFFHFTKYPHDVFVHNHDGAMNLFAQKNDPVEPGYLEQALKFSKWLHIRESSSREIRDSLKNLRASILETRGISPDWIRGEILGEARSLLSRIRSEMPSDPVVIRASGFLKTFSRYLSVVLRDPCSASLGEFIRDAEATDRSLFSLILALLLCARLRFENNAVLEILGLACLLQDISLIHSPFGNLADLSADQIPEEARSFFLRHPLHSADLLAGITPLPASVIQVIRQHHETRDRKGYPNQIGGARIHPLAEVLGIVNRYLEIREKERSPAEIREKLSLEVYPGFAPEISLALESVLMRSREIN